MSKMKLLSAFQLATQILSIQPIKANFVYEFEKMSKIKLLSALQLATQMLTF